MRGATESHPFYLLEDFTKEGLCAGQFAAASPCASMISQCEQGSSVLDHAFQLVGYYCGDGV